MYACSLIFAACSDVRAAPPLQVGTGACEKLITEPSVNDIVREVFENKVQDLARAGILSSDFWNKNKDLGFAVCDNKASYDTFVLYGKGVVFDYQMIGFLFAQSRALIAGAYLSPDNQFVVHSEVVSQFVAQGPALNSGPLAIIEKKALALGQTKIDFDKMTSEPEFKQRELTLFSQALYFLVMHERCHVALDHDVRLEEMKNLSEAEKTGRKQQLELAADRCALDVVNSDERQYKSSPISFFGVLMTVATQSIVANQPKLRTERSHPTMQNRMGIATNVVLTSISQSGVSQSNPASGERYVATIKGTATYFDELLAKLAIVH
jgi:hypothetical protein